MFLPHLRLQASPVHPHLGEGVGLSLRRSSEPPAHSWVLAVPAQGVCVCAGGQGDSLLPCSSPTLRQALCPWIRGDFYRDPVSSPRIDLQRARTRPRMYSE